jgi:hypothetical protein
MTSNNELQRRLAALEKKMNSSEYRGPEGLQTIVGYGFLPPGVPIFANAGALEWFRGMTAEGEIIEDLDVFCHRCHAEAKAAGEKLLTIGFLPRDGSETQRAAAKLAEDYYWANDDNSVPPCEVRR